MVNYIADPLDRVFTALADPTRRAILERLSRGEASVTELAAPFDMSLPAVSKHLRVLETAGLLTREREGRVHRIELAPGPLKAANHWLDFYRRFWNARLDALARIVESPSTEEATSWSRSKRRRSRHSASSAGSRRRPNGSSTRGSRRKH